MYVNNCLKSKTRLDDVQLSFILPNKQFFNVILLLLFVWLLLLYKVTTLYLFLIVAIYLFYGLLCTAIYLSYGKICSYSYVIFHYPVHLNRFLT